MVTESTYYRILKNSAWMTYFGRVKIEMEIEIEMEMEMEMQHVFIGID